MDGFSTVKIWMLLGNTMLPCAGGAWYLYGYKYIHIYIWKYQIIYTQKKFARWQRPNQSKWSNGFSVDTGFVCPREPHHWPKSSTMNRNQQQIHIKCLVHLNAFTSTTRHSYHSCTIMLSPFTVMFTGIWCGIRGDALINPPGHCKEFGHEKWAVCCWATRPPDNWYHLEGSGTHEMILCLLLLLLMLLLLLPLLLFLLWFFLFVLFPNSLE